ncbi:hypothetical protein GXY_02021 [Novacetimonas hansenii ATCC 23769]|uniref:Uncharacterized protein n=1 Tax=Novacetimonas hansenii ATCC 23769 TaxID=714995 RepID=D5QBB1_NOVHA|nr:hypothetical protein GXY_02021 [Novacetimonas hansenii ATCC 23769]
MSLSTQVGAALVSLPMALSGRVVALTRLAAPFVRLSAS